MTDIEKRAYKVTLIRAGTIAISLVACTWKLCTEFNEFSAKINKVYAYVAAQERADSTMKENIAQIKFNRAIDRHDLDSIGGVLNSVTFRVMPDFFNQRRANGRLMNVPNN